MEDTTRRPGESLVRQHNRVKELLDKSYSELERDTYGSALKHIERELRRLPKEQREREETEEAQRQELDACKSRIKVAIEGVSPATLAIVKAWFAADCPDDSPAAT